MTKTAIEQMKERNRELINESPYPFVVELPHDTAGDVTPFIVKASIGYNNGKPFNRRGHVAKRITVKPAIREWLDHSVGQGQYKIGHAARDPVSFFFADEAKAALFKLFWF